MSVRPQAIRRVIACTLIAALLFLPALVAKPAQAQPVSTLSELFTAHRCPLAERLERLHRKGDLASQRDRFIAVSLPEHPHGYVQCMFVELRRKILCEASSGFYFSKPGEPRAYLPDEAVVLLARLGFNTDDAKGNFQALVDVPRRPDFNGIAEFILQALHDGYGARARSRLRINAPMAPYGTSRCTPVG
jgi:hypothetical protein